MNQPTSTLAEMTLTIQRLARATRLLRREVKRMMRDAHSDEKTWAALEASRRALRRAPPERKKRGTKKRPDVQLEIFPEDGERDGPDRASHHARSSKALERSHFA